MTDSAEYTETKLGDKMESAYRYQRSSEEAEPLQGQPLPIQVQKRPFRSRALNVAATVFVGVIMCLSIYQTFLLVRQKSFRSQCDTATILGSQRHLRVIDCGKSVAEAKAIGCTWDELSKAWLPKECPRYGLEEYKLQGMLSNPHQNATSWAYYWDQEGKSNLNIDVVAADEDRDIAEKVWTTSRQHLAHCAGVLKRTIWSYEKGYGHYDAIAMMSHAHHCVDTLLRGAIKAEGDLVDSITTLTGVSLGHCSFYENEREN